MIVRGSQDGLLLFRQTDHALLSGAFAAAWGNERFPEPVRRRSTLVAAARHDDGWAQWELAPKLADDGSPVDFIGIPISEHVELYRRGIELVESEDAFAGLVVSMHGERLYTKPFLPGMDPRIEHLEGEGLGLARTYVEDERKRQERLLSSIAAAEDVAGSAVHGEAEEAWRLLQVWDRLSLVVCMQPLVEATAHTMPTVADGHGEQIGIRVRGGGGDTMFLDPYPFSVDPVELQVEAFRTTADRWDTGSAYREAFRTARREIFGFRCRAGA